MTTTIIGLNPLPWSLKHLRVRRRNNGHRRIELGAKVISTVNCLPQQLLLCGQCALYSSQLLRVFLLQMHFILHGVFCYLAHHSRSRNVHSVVVFPAVNFHSHFADALQWQDVFVSRVVPDKCTVGLVLRLQVRRQVRVRCVDTTRIISNVSVLQQFGSLFRQTQRTGGTCILVGGAGHYCVALCLFNAERPRTKLRVAFAEGRDADPVGGALVQAVVRLPFYFIAGVDLCFERAPLRFRVSAPDVVRPPVHQSHELVQLVAIQRAFVQNVEHTMARP